MAAAKHNTGLGRGLGDLFAKTDDDGAPMSGSESLKDGSYFAHLPLAQVKPNSRQPRTNFDEDDLEELTASVAEFGVLQPVVVREVGRKRFELVMGERRYRASVRAGLETLPAIVRATDDESLLRDALLENLHRANLNPLEEASAYQQLLDDFGCTKEELGRRIHRSRPQISNTLRLLNLPATVQRKVAAGVLSAGHARALLGLGDPRSQELLADRIIAEGLSVRSTEEIVAMGEGRSVKERASRGPREQSEQESGIGRSLSDHFDTRVKVDIGRDKGKITIEFATEEDLQRILAIIDQRQL